MFLGVDIGGANTKFASSDGVFIRSIYLPLWLDDSLQKTLQQARLDAEDIGKIEAVGVVMTGELSDCFPTQSEGVQHIAHAVNSVFIEAHFLNYNGEFNKNPEPPEQFCAANWLASAILIGEKYANALMVDMGTTTTDIIPITNGKPVAEQTDFERIGEKQLLYTGVLRTNTATILPAVNIGNSSYRGSSELFAITADVYLILGEIKLGEYSCDAPDHYAYPQKEDGKTVEAAMRRLARTVCSEPRMLGEEALTDMALQVKQAQLNELKDAISYVAGKHDLGTIVAMGTGEFLIREAANELDMSYISISEEYGEELSAVFPAYAAAKLLEKLSG